MEPSGETTLGGKPPTFEYIHFKPWGNEWWNKKISYKVADKDKRVAVIIIMKKRWMALLITTLLTPLFTFINSRRTNTNVLSHRNVHNSQDRSQNLPGSLTYPLGEWEVSYIFYRQCHTYLLNDNDQNHFYPSWLIYPIFTIIFFLFSQSFPCRMKYITSKCEILTFKVVSPESYTGNALICVASNIHLMETLSAQDH